MPTKPTMGKIQIATQITADVLEQFRVYVRGRGETFSAALERAMRREMAYPPPRLELPPLPDSPRVADAGAAEGKKRRGRPPKSK